MQNQSDDIIQLKSWQAVGVWRWKINQDICAIDKQSLQSPCLECDKKNENMLQESQQLCNIEIGQCNHAFHQHCLAGWLNKNPTCPYCNVPWIKLNQ